VEGQLDRRAGQRLVSVVEHGKGEVVRPDGEVGSGDQERQRAGAALRAAACGGGRASGRRGRAATDQRQREKKGAYFHRRRPRRGGTRRVPAIGYRSATEDIGSA